MPPQWGSEESGCNVKKAPWGGSDLPGPCRGKDSHWGSGLSAPSSQVPEVGSTGVEAPQAGVSTEGAGTGEWSYFGTSAWQALGWLTGGWGDQNQEILWRLSQSAGPNVGEARAGPGVVRMHRREGAERAAEVKS